VPHDPISTKLMPELLSRNVVHVSCILMLGFLEPAFRDMKVETHIWAKSVLTVCDCLPLHYRNRLGRVELKFDCQLSLNANKCRHSGTYVVLSYHLSSVASALNILTLLKAVTGAGAWGYN